MTSLHTGPIEILWFLQSLSLLVWFMLLTRRAFTMLEYLKENNINGRIQVAAKSNMRQELIRASIATVMVASSGTALFLAPPPPSYFELPQSLVMLVAWNLIGALMLVQSALDRSATNQLNEEQE